MAKTNRGGKRVVANNQPTPTPPQPQTNDQQSTPPPTPIKQPKKIVISKYRNMTDDEKADQIKASLKGGVPAHLAQNAFQKFLYNTKLNDNPEVVDDATFKKAKGVSLYRTVNSVFDRTNDISYTAQQIANQVMRGTYTRVSDTGGSAYGRGLYFDQSKSGSANYGNTRGNVQKTAMIYAKLKQGAPVITHSQAMAGLRSEINKGTKLGKALKGVNSTDGVSIWALSKGYAAIKSGNGSSEYHNVVDRS